MSIKVPDFKTDEEAIAFLEQDLSELDFSQFKSMTFTFEQNSETIAVPLPESLLAAVRKRAGALGISDQIFIRTVIETAISKLP